jgi:hypothetical protein
VTPGASSSSGRSPCCIANSAAEHELEPDSKAVQWRVARPEHPHPRRRTSQAVKRIVVFAGRQREVVAEPLRLLVGVRVAPDVDEEGGVVDDRPRVIIEADALGDPKGDQALAQDVLHRLPEAEVDAQRQGGDQFRQANMAPVQLLVHALTLPRAMHRGRVRD